MNISYKRDMTHNYMVPEIAEGICEDDYRVHMLMENHIRGLLPCSLKHVNCQSRFFYDITSRQSMEHIYGGRRMGVEDIVLLLRGLHRTLKEVKKYLLDEDQIVLEPEMIYMDIETREPLFCYLPGYRKDIVQSFRELSAYLLEHLDRSDSRAVLLGYEVYQKAREENYSLEKILQEAGRPQAAPDGDLSRSFAEEGRLGADYEEAAHGGTGYGENTRGGTDYGENTRGGTDYGENIRGGTGYGENVRGGTGYGENIRGGMGHGGNAHGGTDYRGDQRGGVDYGENTRSGMGRGGEPQGGAEGRKAARGSAGRRGNLRGSIGREEEEKAKPRKGDRKKKKEREDQDFPHSGETETANRSGRIFLAACFLTAILLLLAAAWFWGLSLTQIGGIAFLLVGILIYGFSMEGKSQKKKEKRENRQMEEVLDQFQEEPYYEEAPFAKTPKREPIYREPAFQGAHREQPSHFAEHIPYEAGSGGYGANAGGSYGAGAGMGGGYRANMDADGYVEQKRKSRLGDTGILFEDGDFVQRLVLVSMNPRQKDSFILERDSYIVGKLPERCDIVIDHPSVSRVHARLERQGKDYYLCDLNSTNGTFLNGKRLMVNERALIHPGDEIGFARVGYQVGRC